MKNEDSSVIGVTQNLLQSTLQLEKEDEMRRSLREMKDETIKRLGDDPINTIGVAFSLGFAAMRVLRSPKPEVRKEILRAAGVALVYGVMSPLLQSKETDIKEKFH